MKQQTTTLAEPNFRTETLEKYISKRNFYFGLKHELGTLAIDGAKVFVFPSAEEREICMKEWIKSPNTGGYDAIYSSFDYPKDAEFLKGIAEQKSERKFVCPMVYYTNA